MTNITVAIVFHSGRGHTARHAEAVRRGVANVDGASVLLLTSEEAQDRWGDLEQADAIIFGAPTHMGSASGKFKTFMDASSKPFFTGAWKDKIAAGFTKLCIQIWRQAFDLDAVRGAGGTTRNALGKSWIAAR